MDPDSNPLFQTPKSLPPLHGKIVQPLQPDEEIQSASPAKPAVEIIRKKLDSLYSVEPSAEVELQEVKQPHVHLSKHQKFLQSLTGSGLSLAEIQKKWHEYYVNLPDREKHEVWQEFYRQQPDVHSQPSVTASPHKAQSHHTSAKVHHRTLSEQPVPLMATPAKTISEIKDKLLGSVAKRGASKRKHHYQSLLFGAGLGSVVILVLLFGFFNERFIAPFITPSKTVTNTPIIVDPASVTAASPEPKIIIPKINVEVPVVYGQVSTEEEAFQKALESGVVQYHGTAEPGQQGNVVIFGHSSNNIFNPGKYKFAFVLLRKLETGDLIILHKDSKRYVYRVYEKEVVPPTDLSVLEPRLDKPATVTLITCDPPGTSINRLIVYAEQITPDPSGNSELPTEVANASTASKIRTVPGNAPSLWSRFVNWLGF